MIARPFRETLQSLVLQALHEIAEHPPRAGSTVVTEVGDDESPRRGSWKCRYLGMPATALLPHVRIVNIIRVRSDDLPGFLNERGFARRDAKA